ncbi:MAG: bifunctional diguanylate cyclase/phosphodiesterase [Gammaproteobacteria bacterium]|nr:bifunctional diguanylate cyclase/phosphodiesterase [Gammaproteobacteria bacterium]
MYKPFNWRRSGLTENQGVSDGDIGKGGDVKSAAGERAADSRSSAVSNLVLVVSKAGTVTSVPNSPESELNGRKLVGSSIDDLLSAAMAGWVRERIKRTLRSRDVQSAEFENAAENQQFECIFVATGRDSVLFVARDISARVSADSKVQTLAYVDSVTGLPNREYLIEKMTPLLNDLLLKEGRAAVMCFDIDQVDLHGRVSGARKADAIMKELGERIREGLRRVNDPDPVDNERYSVAARIDYRQFGVVLPDIGGGADAEAVTSRLTESMEQPIRIGSSEVRVTVRAGIALFPQDGTDTETLFANAMTAMEDARRHHVDSHKLHSGTVRMRALERKDLEVELRTALERKEFDLNFLPIVDASTRSTVSAEALLRWPSALFGSKSIQRVVTLAEHTGLIVPIGEWVIRSSCAQLRAWQDAGHAGLRVAINVSVQEFSRASLAEKIAAAICDNGLSPEKIDLEITEHMLFRDAMKGFEACSALKDIGVGIILDDFGTGACSIAHLSRSPVDAIKIDNGFVTHVASSEEDRNACGAMVAMGHELGMRVIAEGVETEEQAELLQSRGCDLLQGFLFCKPLACSEFDAYLAEHGPQQGKAL